jgi:hypothetical protein
VDLQIGGGKGAGAKASICVNFFALLIYLQIRYVMDISPLSSYGYIPSFYNKCKMENSRVMIHGIMDSLPFTPIILWLEITTEYVKQIQIKGLTPHQKRVHKFYKLLKSSSLSTNSSSPYTKKSSLKTHHRYPKPETQLSHLSHNRYMYERDDFDLFATNSK